MKSISFFLSLLVFIGCKSISGNKLQGPNGWEIKETPTEASLRALSPVSEDIAWVSGSGGVWMRTLDGGNSWDHGIIAGMDSVDFRSIHGIDSEVAIAASAGQPAVIYKTSDGGKNWHLVHQEGELAFLDGISFVDSERGYVFGDPVDEQWMILETQNGGESWNLIPSAPMAVEGEAGFAASASSLLAFEDFIWLGTGGMEANLWESLDQGVTWKKYASPLIQGESSQGIFSIVRINENKVFAAGGDYLNPEEREGNSGLFQIEGKAWEQIITPPLGYRSGVAFYDPYNWLITVGPDGSDFSADEGKTWKTFSSEGFHAVKVSQKGVSVWASGAKGKIAKLKF